MTKVVVVTACAADRFSRMPLGHFWCHRRV